MELLIIIDFILFVILLGAFLTLEATPVGTPFKRVWLPTFIGVTSALGLGVLSVYIAIKMVTLVY